MMGSRVLRGWAVDLGLSCKRNGMSGDKTIVTIFRNTKFYHKQLNLNCFLYSKEKWLSQVFTFDSNFCFCSCFCTHYRPQEKNHVFTGHFVCLAGGNLSAAWPIQATLLAWTKIVNDPLSDFLCFIKCQIIFAAPGGGIKQQKLKLEINCFLSIKYVQIDK